MIPRGPPGPAVLYSTAVYPGTRCAGTDHSASWRRSDTGTLFCSIDCCVPSGRCTGSRLAGTERVSWENVIAMFSTYSDSYQYIRFDRRDGIIQVTIHKSGGSAVWNASPAGIHAALGDAFYRIGRDAENRVVIFTGTGDEFLTQMDLSGSG